MIDVLLHVLGALVMQAVIGGALLAISLPVPLAAIVAAVPAGGFWLVREYWQAHGRQKADGQPTDFRSVWGRIHTKEWTVPVAAVAFVAVLATVTSAGAQQPPTAAPKLECGPAVLIQEGLRSQHGEITVAKLKLGNGVPAIIVANLATGSYTVLIFPEPTVACIGAAGSDFKLVVIPKDTI